MPGPLVLAPKFLLVQSLLDPELLKVTKPTDIVWDFSYPNGDQLVTRF